MTEGLYSSRLREAGEARAQTRAEHNTNTEQKDVLHPGKSAWGETPQPELPRKSQGENRPLALPTGLLPS